jgi:poly(A) polymerase
MLHEPGNIAADENVRELGRLAGEYGVKAYLVGGSVRDLLLGRELKDLDFALSGSSAEIAAAFARSVGGSFFWLDEERLQSRVVKKGAVGSLTFDFAPQRGETIAEDLLQRDFSINALALPLAGEGCNLIDPANGVTDLESGIIRACSAETFADDPLRLLRAIRFAATLGFTIDTATWEALVRQAAFLERVAAERIRDELFQILAAPGIEASLLLLLDSGLLPRIIPRLLLGTATPPEEEYPSSLNQRIGGAGRVEQLAAELADYFPADHERLRQHLNSQVEAGIGVLSLVKLAAFINGAAPPGATDLVAAKLRLGKRARRILEKLARSRTALAGMAEHKLTARAMYHFFSDSDPAGPEIALFALAGERACRDFCVRLVAYYFSDYPAAGAGLLLSGAEIMHLLGIGPGLAVGEAMERLKKAESIGMVNTRAEAEAFLKKNQLTKEEPIG